MTFSQHARLCRICQRKRRLRLDTLMCRECLGEPAPQHLSDDSPAVLTGRWVPNGRGTMFYVEQVAS